MLRDYPSLRGLNRINLAQSLSCPRLALWMKRQRLVPLKDVEARSAPGRGFDTAAE
jgi:hypothetical protein